MSVRPAWTTGDQEEYRPPWKSAEMGVIRDLVRDLGFKAKRKLAGYRRKVYLQAAACISDLPTSSMLKKWWEGLGTHIWVFVGGRQTVPAAFSS